MCSVLAIPFSVQASEYGCKVLLCLSNPGGPKEHAECHPPIDQLYDDLKEGRAFPRCEEAGNNYAKLVFDPYDPCPDNTRAAAAGSHVQQGQKGDIPALASWNATKSRIAAGQPDNNHANPVRISEKTRTSGRACVGNTVGQYTLKDCTDCKPYTVFVYDKVIWQMAQSPRAIDVFLNGVWSRRIRY
ncbi:hypothetical protein I2492_01140 [Budviciaceae bacterium CWB-B4]|uniref:Uncharacterized protein n=1 Tax=Limnobaculum xujianqingii TaxID=2738837 RepID=A0A9D7AF69_9GAMM|nr:hypothetical protein [Limnobaculum xujianqingii]MBK5071619.1 hypothetical protein [Limnobaculum xujianqingii]MBK5174928.1 hypothetical protein [Limnobaculum xujianqingii]